MQGEASESAAANERPSCVVLGVRDGYTPSQKAPVRIFIGTEARQFRAQRIMLWSIERHRDPSRVYEIYLMKDIRGFRRHRWLTGFTNYRFAIPEFAGFTGRAIYNDIDQIYLKDPALLFDTDMHGHGFLSIHDHDTSVMLIDCERMGELWNLDTARHQRRRDLEAQARKAKLWGQLDPGWNARDTEYHPDTSHLVHFTTIHTQPWRPCPREYVYGENPVGELWFGYEREADKAGFLEFDAGNPGPEYQITLADWQHRDFAASQSDFKPAMSLLKESQADEVHYYGSRPPVPENVALQALNAADLTHPGKNPGDAVICADFLEYMPDEDIPWLLESLFASSKRTLSLLISPYQSDHPGGHRRDSLWWYAQVAATAVRHPHIHWQLVVATSKRKVKQWEGGAPLNWPPKVWVLAHYKTGHNHQAQDIADALGWPYEKHELSTDTLRPILALISDRLFGRAWGMPSLFMPPWPDLVIASGWLPAKIACWIGRQSGGRTRLVLMGRKAGPAEESQDILVSCAHFRLAHHPRRIQTLLPVHKGYAANQPVAKQAQAETENNLHIGLLIGGTSRYYRLTPQTTRELARKALEFARDQNAELSVVTSRRTGSVAEQVIAEELAGKGIIHSWSQGARRQDFNQVLSLADKLIVTGESESMLTEAIITGKSVYIYPLPRRRSGPLRLFAHWVERQAATPRYNRRNTIKPQEGLRYICARLIERGLVLPLRAVDPMHDELIRQGLAYNFADLPKNRGNIPTDKLPVPDREVAGRIIELLKWHESVGQKHRQGDVPDPLDFRTASMRAS
jgi:uncharacterized protein